MRYILAFSILLITLSGQVFARSVLQDATLRAGIIPNCTMNETVTININFNNVVDSPTKAKPVFDEMLNTVKTAAAEQGVEGFSVQSMNYNVSPNQSGTLVSNYGLNGSVSFTAKQGDKAAKLMEALNGKGITSSMSVSAYHNGNCPQPTVAD
jgi:hypothetical protein